MIQPATWRSLGNTQGAIALRMHLGALSDSVEYRGAIEAGRSWERDFDSTGTAFESLFYRSTAICRSTPCNDNSARPVPVAVDIAFVPGSLRLECDSVGVTTIAASFWLVNYGYRESGAAAVHVFDDADRDGVGSASEWMLDYQGEALAGGDSAEVTLSISANTGRHRIIFQLDDDEVLANNIATGEITVGPITREVVITEFLADPTGELESEWIEIRNVAAYPIDLSGWKVGDLSHQNLMEAAPILEPGEYCVIAQDKIAFTGYYGNSCQPLFCKSWSSLNNGGDCIVLRDEFGTISDSVSYSGGAGENRSLELNEAAVPGLPHWNPSRSTTGSTPCGANSVLPAPAAHDAGFVENGMTIRKDSLDAELIHFTIDVANYGYLKLERTSIDIFDDRNHNGVPDDDELLTTVETGSIESGDTTTVAFSLQIPTGRHRLISRLPDDEAVDNNMCRVEISTGTLLREIIVTEFLADPTGELESEWIEIRNVSGRTIDFRGWSCGDLATQHAVELSRTLAPDEYAILAQDSAAFASFYGDGCAIIALSSWSSLNNGGDCIVLCDEFGTISDSVSYSDGAGENRSIERNESAIEAASWYPSTSLSGATPCGANSVSAEYSGATSFVLLHRVFAPTAGEELHFAIQCPPASRFTIEVFDMVGRRQRVIADDKYFSSGESSYDGLSDFYSHLPVGAYIIKVESEDGSFSQKAGFAVAPPK
ncbi:MAG: lamin tail domain-containing protein [bacterium]|nr:lamin tail domain-containing protein [bacterium]